MFRNFALAWRLGLGGLVAAILVCASEAGAQPLADRVPADSIVYFGWQGAEGLTPAYGKSRLKAVLDATDANQILDTFIPQLVKRVSQEKGEDAKQAAEVGKVFGELAGPLWRYPVAFYFAGVDWEKKMPKLGVLCQAGADSVKLRDQIRGMMKDAPQEAKNAIEIEDIDGVLVVSLGYADAKSALGSKEKSLSTADDFKAAAGQVGKMPAVMAYIDAEKLMALVEKAIDREGPPDAKQMWPKVKSATGLEGLKRIAWSTGFDGKDWGEHLFVAAPGPRKGLLSLLDGEPISDAAYAMIPQSATLAGLARFDAAKVVTVLRQVAGDIDPNAGEQLSEMLKMLNDQVKVDLQKDLLAALGDEWAYYTSPEIGGRGSAGVVLVNKLRDEKKFAAAIAKLQEVAIAEITKATQKEDVKLSIYTTKVDGLTISYLGTPLVTPSWAIQDGTLYVGLFPQTVAAAAAHVREKGKSILDNKDFLAVRDRLGGTKATAIAFMDLPRTAPDSYAMWAMISRVSGFADLLGVQSPAMLLPPMHKLMAQLTPAGSAAWVDDAGWHARAVMPFPGAQLLASEPIGALMLPSMLMGYASERRAAIAPVPPAQLEAAPQLKDPPQIGPQLQIRG